MLKVIIDAQMKLIYPIFVGYNSYKDLEDEIIL